MKKKPLDRLGSELVANLFRSGGMGAKVMDLSKVKRDPAKEGALSSTNKLLIHPYAFWEQFSQDEISYFCVTQGLYCIPTVELVDWLKAEIGGRVAIEVGAGNGVLAAALGIAATDTRQQEKEPFKTMYLEMQQTPVKYGDHVEEFDAVDAVCTMKPEVVVAAWVTHKFREHEAWRKGNEYGVREEEIVRRAVYIHVGNSSVHRHKPILEIPHAEHQFPWLVSRAFEGQDFIAVWGKPA